MGRRRLTVREVEALQPGGAVWDTEVLGLGARHRGGWPRYVLRYRTRAGRRRQVQIGPHGSPWTPETARAEARRLLGDVAAGRDPAARRDQARGLPTVEAFAERWLREHVAARRSAGSLGAYRGVVARRIVPAWGRLRLDALGRGDVAEWHRAMAATPTEANRALAVLSALFAAAIRWGVLLEGTPNPARGVERFAEVKRRRYLTGPELAVVGACLRRLEAVGLPAVEGQEYTRPSPAAAAALRLLLLTGARHDEIAGLRWEWCDLEAGVLRLPAGKTGGRDVRLPPPAVELLRGLPRLAENPFVFVGRGGRGRVSSLRAAWERVRRVAGIEDVRIHDLRHTWASVAAGSGYSLRIVGELLGHAQAQTTQRYAHVADDPAAAAAADVAARIARALGEPQG